MLLRLCYCVRVVFLVILFGGMPVWVSLLSYWNFSYDYVQSFFQDDPSSFVFDFIVVGGGSSGLAISHRLSKHHKVLLIEAGGDPIALHNIPALAYVLLNQPSVDWAYESVPQQHAGLAYIDRKIRFPRGKSLGGSSNLNFMLYLQANPQDYNHWANLTKSETWKYENVLPYFKKSLDYDGKYSENLQHYGKSEYGNLHVDKMRYAPLGREFIEAGKELGYDEIDANSDQRTGFGDVEVTMKHGSRWSTYRAYLQGMAYNSNLRVLRYSQCTKIEIDDRKHAVGVHYTQYGRKKYAKASREIIISAGAIDSPKLLMLSGIGPQEHLRSLGIKVKVHNAEVGNNLMDHIAVPLVPITIDQPKSVIPLRDYNFDAFIDYMKNGKGVLTNPSAISAQAFISSSFVNKSGTDWPDLQLYIFSLGYGSTIVEDMKNFNSYNDTIIRPVLERVVGNDGFLILVTLVRPKGHGEIKLLNKNPFTAPLINPRFLENADDMAVLIEGMKLAIKLTKTKTLRKVGTKFDKIVLPQCDAFEWMSDKYWDCYIRHFALSLYHPVGTCSMGKVVDSTLKVQNVRGLRVADASIMPEIVNANTNAPSIMIGEKAADFIREYWAFQFQICDLAARLFFTDDNRCFYSKMS